MANQEVMNNERSGSIKELATALAKAQASMSGARKDMTNPHFKSKYADLASIWDAARAPLTGNGIAVVQFTRPSERNEVIVQTFLLHASGEWMSGEIAIPVNKADAQGYGSALTYARRYALAAAVGIAPEDDDGNAASRDKANGVDDEHIAHQIADFIAAMDEAEDAELWKQLYRNAYRAANGNKRLLDDLLAAKARATEWFKATEKKAAPA